MRAVVLSYSHHGRGIGGVIAELGHEIVGVMDPEEGPRQALARHFACPGYPNAAACLEAARPDVALVAGKHVEMPDHILACAERGVPYLLDKPFADCAERLRPAAEATARHGVFSALTLPNRRSRVVQTVKDMLADGSLGQLVLCGSRLNNGPPARYDPTPSAWHNDPSVSGGGSFAVEAAHGIDTFLQLTGAGRVKVVGATLSNALHRRGVEDIGIGLFRSATGATGLVEAGYCYPSGARAGDHFFRFVGTRATVLAQYGKAGEPLIEVHTPDGVEFSEDLSHGERMRCVVRDALAALEAGEAFEADVQDAVRVLEIQDAVYRFARSTPQAAGPHPLGDPPPGPGAP